MGSLESALHRTFCCVPDPLTMNMKEELLTFAVTGLKGSFGKHRAITNESGFG